MNDNKHAGYGIFLSMVKAEDKYRIPQPPKVYRTKELAEKDLAKMLKQGWKKSELKIMDYVLETQNIAPRKFKAGGGSKTKPNLPRQKSSIGNKLRFLQFTRDLAKLSSKYGIAIQSVGGVHFFDHPVKIWYSDDHSSGDLDPLWIEKEKTGNEKRRSGYGIFPGDVKAKDK